MHKRTLTGATLCALLLGALRPGDASALPDCNNPAERNAPICQGTRPPPPTPTVHKKASMYPAYLVLTTLYDPPGNLSEVDYGQGSSTGIQVTDQQNYKAGVNVQVTAGAVVASAGFNAGPVTGSQWTVNKQRDTTLSLVSTQDTMAHAKDVSYVWVNPEVDLDATLTGTRIDAVSQSLSAKGGAPLIVPVLAQELQNPSLLPGYKKEQLKSLTTADVAQILRANPLVGGESPARDGKRYLKVQSLQLDGPDQAGDPLTGAGVDVIAQQQQGNVVGMSESTTASLGFSSGFSFFDILKVEVQASATFEWDNQTTSQLNAGTQQSITVKLMTSTVGFHDVIDVYLDRLYGSFAFVSETGASTPADKASLWGHVTDAAGKPVANQRVDVTLGDGSRRPVFTNARGIYRVFLAPSGTASASMPGGNGATAQIAAGRSALLDLRR